MLQSLGLVIITAIVCTVFTIYIMRSSHRDLIDAAKHKQIQLSDSIADLEHRLMLSEQECERIVGNNAKEYTSYISQFLENAADKSDVISKELENASQQVNALNQSVKTVQAKSNETENASDTGMEHVKLVASNLEAFSRSNESLQNIQQQFTEVQKKTEAIRFIGEEAEMLALNAAIEAARAGEAGRGFAVVADAMKSLARNSQESTVSIQSIVSESENTINGIVEEYFERNEQFNDNVKLLLDSFTQIKTSITEINDQSNYIQNDTHSASQIIAKAETDIKTTMEKQVADLSKLVSLITGVEVINLLPQEAKRRLNEFDQIIDVRRPEEFNDNLGHISNARLSTLQTDFKNDVKVLDPNKCYLFVCRSGGRSTKAAQMAINHGVTEVYNLDGGMLAWNK